MNLSLKASRWTRHPQLKDRVRREGERQRERPRQAREMSGIRERTIISKTVDHVRSHAGTVWWQQTSSQWNPHWNNRADRPLFCQSSDSQSGKHRSSKAKECPQTQVSTVPWLSASVEITWVFGGKMGHSYIHSKVAPWYLFQLFYLRLPSHWSTLHKKKKFH